MTPSPRTVAKTVVRDIARQPRMLAASIGTLAVGLATRRPELVRNGVRLLAVQVAVSAARHGVEAMRSRDGDAASSPGLPAVVLGSAAAWAAETLVDTVYSRLADRPHATDKDGKTSVPAV